MSEKHTIIGLLTCGYLAIVGALSSGRKLLKRNVVTYLPVLTPYRGV